MEEKQLAGLKKLRNPFPDNQISKLPKFTRKQTEESRSNPSVNINCKLCGGRHHKHAIHLDYVGHAALTDRLLDADPEWNWEPLSSDEKGLPALDLNGGLWIKLTVCGVSRLGYGDAPGKSGGDAMKERIGDALRNAAMRFGAALDLWHKGDLHEEEESPSDVITSSQVREIRQLLTKGGFSEKSLCSKNGIQSLDQFPASRFDGLVNFLKDKVAQAPQEAPDEQDAEAA